MRAKGRGEGTDVGHCSNSSLPTLQTKCRNRLSPSIIDPSLFSIISCIENRRFPTSESSRIQLIPVRHMQGTVASTADFLANAGISCSGATYIAPSGDATPRRLRCDLDRTARAAKKLRSRFASRKLFSDMGIRYPRRAIAARSPASVRKKQAHRCRPSGRRRFPGL